MYDSSLTTLDKVEFYCKFRSKNSVRFLLVRIVEFLPRQSQSEERKKMHLSVATTTPMEHMNVLRFLAYESGIKMKKEETVSVQFSQLHFLEKHVQIRGEILRQLSPFCSEI